MLFFAQEWVLSCKSKMTFPQKLAYYLFKKTKGLDWSSAALKTTGEKLKSPKKSDGKKLLESEFGRGYREKLDLDEDYHYPRYTASTVEYKKE